MPFNATLWVLKESQIESCKHENDSNVDHQSFPEMVSKDQGIYSDDGSYHQQYIEEGNHRSCHGDLQLKICHLPIWLRQGVPRFGELYGVGPGIRVAFKFAEP